MGSLKSRLESWIRDQTVRMCISWPPPLPQPPPLWKWPPWKGRESRKEQERLLREEYERQRRQLNDLCRAVKAESLADLQDVLCSMVLSECVYKRPASEMLRFINKFKSDFGGQIVALERVQHSLDHVPHRYLLAEAGDTLFASFIGTKQYKDVIADANIFQGAIFHDDHAEDLNVIGSAESNQLDAQKKSEGTVGKSLQVKPQTRKTSKPAAHRGFLARAKGIPALELYKLAQQKNRKLVLCGHSLGGAVATLATLAILRVLASTLSKEQEKVQVKCITFSQPPVGNAALKDYVDRKGWQHYFKTYCIPEDVVPRILSPAYFHHYNEQTIQRSADSTNSHPTSVNSEELIQGLGTAKPKANDGEPLVLGLGPLQTSVWRLSKLVPLEGIRKQINVLKRVGRGAGEVFSTTDRVVPLTADEVEGEPQSLEIEEGSEGITLNPLPEKEKRPTEGNGSSLNGKNGGRDGDSRRWQRVPYLPSYVPFGQLYLLGNSSVESLSDAEYSKLTSVKSVISELKERLQSHSMKSYRSRFQSIYDQCMGINTSLFLGIEQLPQFPQLQKWLGLAAVGAVELGHIVDPSVIQTATSIVPLGWTGVPADKNSEPLKVDVLGHGLHLCTLVQAQVNGSWCSTVVESLPCAPPHRPDNYVKPDLQKMRIIVGPPLKQPPKYPVLDECVSSSLEYDSGAFVEEKRLCAEGLGDLIIYCTSDFITVSKKVHVRTRRVRLLGFEGAGKTSLFRAVMEHARQRSKIRLENLHQFMDSQEGVGGGVCYLDSSGINLQELHLESARFKEELHAGSNDLNKKTDLVVLVHNLSHKVPLYHQMQASQPQPALSILLNEAKALNIPWILAITNKFSVSANQQKMMAKYAMDAYGASSSMTEAINSCPFVMPSSASSLQLQDPVEEKVSRKDAAQRMLLAPLAFARMPFKSKASILPVEGVAAFQQLVHRVLRSNEEIAFQELANERYVLELAREQERALSTRQDSQGKGSSVTAAAVGASLGAGLGLVLALVMGAASALRKP